MTNNQTDSTPCHTQSQTHHNLTDTNRHHQGNTLPSGFALIAVVSVMALLIVCAMAMLSLASITQRHSGEDKHMVEAKANARVSLLMALGELQKNLGPDQRINALSGITVSDTYQATQPWLTGVWDARTESLNQTPDYDLQKPFKRWLVSNADSTALETLSFGSAGQLQDPVRLVGSHTVGGENPSLFVQAGKIPVKGGNYAWWVGDENSKSLINPKDPNERNGNRDTADHLAGFAHPGPHGIQALGEFSAWPTNTLNNDKAITFGQSDLIADGLSPKATVRPYFHDLTTQAQSVLCSVTKGALRKDLNLYLERKDINWLADWPQSGGPKAPLGPNKEIALSPPSEYDVLSWKHLHHHYHSDRMVTYVGASKRPQLESLRANAAVNALNNPKWNSGVTRLAVVPIRVQVFLAFGSIKDPYNPGKYLLRFYMYPVLTLWNPYNVDLRVSGYHILLNTLPLKHLIQVNGINRQNYGWSEGYNNSRGSGTVLAVRDVTFKPGESQSFSPVNWGPESGGYQAHYFHEMKPIAHDYSPSKPGSVWGEGYRGVWDPPIFVSGSSSDKINILSQANNFDDGDGDFQFKQTTFSFRGQDLYTGDGNWPTFLWSSAVGWRHEKGSPRPDEFSTNNPAQDTFGNPYFIFHGWLGWYTPPTTPPRTPLVTCSTPRDRSA
ncbi:MAG: hypothetical protein H7A51_07695 [Akkermansiaceae bacterium]|nr:hypothetical protein [Akkermansiaceae bacterium]